MYNQFIFLGTLDFRIIYLTGSLLENEKKNHICTFPPNKLGILLPKLFWPTVRKYCSSDREKLLKFEAESREFSKFLRSLEQFIQTVKGQNNVW